MGYWDNLFETEARSGAGTGRMAAGALGGGADLRALRDLLLDQEGRIAKLELAVEALVEVLRERKTLTRDEVAVMIQQIDLADGVEDGRIGPDRVAEAPVCHVCGRPVNPRREECLYCREPIRRGEAPPVRTTRCARCDAEVPEIETFFSDRGLLCGDCHRR